MKKVILSMLMLASMNVFSQDTTSVKIKVQKKELKQEKKAEKAEKKAEKAEKKENKQEKREARNHQDKK